MSLVEVLWGKFSFVQLLFTFDLILCFLFHIIEHASFTAKTSELLSGFFQFIAWHAHFSLNWLELFCNCVGWRPGSTSQCAFGGMQHHPLPYYCCYDNVTFTGYVKKGLGYALTSHYRLLSNNWRCTLNMGIDQIAACLTALEPVFKLQ
jgi:hypothetical protein